MNVKFDAPVEMPSKIPEEMPDNKELEKKKVSIIPAPLINPDEEKGENRHKYYRFENRLEDMPPLPTVILHGKKSRKTLDSRVDKEMGKFPDTWRGFFAYFDEEPEKKGKVDGYVVNLCLKGSGFDFELNGRYYIVSSYKLDKIEGAKSSFNYIGLNNSDVDMLGKEKNQISKSIIDTLNGKYKNGKW